jgi:hypothetical protein
MHFHLPKPLHGWRAFAGEVGIIVVGVLIALAAEQVVEGFHQRRALREAEEAMIAELRDDNLPQAYTRAAVLNCYDDQLGEIENAVASGDRAKTESLAKAYHPVIRTWDDEAWKAAMDSQVLVNAGASRMTRWASPYVMIPALANRSDAEQQELPHLWAKQSGTGALTAEQQDRMFDIIALLRRHNEAMTGASLVLMRQEASIGLRLTKQRKAELLAEARRAFGNCAAEPSPERLNMKSQLGAGDDKVIGRR